jgi:hypothetical protein
VSGKAPDESRRIYEEVVARRDAIRDAWLAEDCPLTSEGSTGQMVEHPLVKMLREHDALVEKLGKSLAPAHRGPAPRAVLTPSPAAKLRSVK